MTIDARATAWHHLFPPETAFTARSGPETFRQAVEILSTGNSGRVLVLWSERFQDLPSLASFAGLVAINGRRITGRRLQDAGFPYVRRFAVLPSMKDPRWFIPLGVPQVAEKALRINTPFRFVPRLKHLGVRMAARSGLSPLFRNQVIIAQRTMPPLERALADALGISSFELSISTGTPTPARKPTIAVLAPNGQRLAFVKLSGSAISRRLVQNDARCLRYLGSHRSIARYVPVLLFDSEIDGVFVMAQRSLPGTMPGTRLTESHRTLLEILGNGPEKLAIDTGFMRSLIVRMGTIANQHPDVSVAFQLARQALQGVVVKQTVMHGDFVPWNLRYHDGVISAFDWEYGDIDGLPLVDEMHYRWQSGLRLQRWTEDQAFEHLLTFRSIQRTGRLEPRAIRALQILSLLDVLSRKITEGHPTTSLGPMLLNLVQRLLPYLEEDER